MTDAVMVALLATIPPTLFAAASLITSLRNTAKLTDVHLSLNSRLTSLIEASHAQGRQDERDDLTTKAAEK